MEALQREVKALASLAGCVKASRLHPPGHECLSPSPEALVSQTKRLLQPYQSLTHAARQYEFTAALNWSASIQKFPFCFCSIVCHTFSNWDGEALAYFDLAV